eukprot:m.82700 g.82700  ORF g.82700 m.82700 type:complete len:93 (+) comp12097_c1_seq1:1994-2272(+)
MLVVRCELVFSPPLDKGILDEEEFAKEWKHIKHLSNKTPHQHKKRSSLVEMIFMGAIMCAMFWAVVLSAWNHIDDNQKREVINAILFYFFPS